MRVKTEREVVEVTVERMVPGGAGLARSGGIVTLVEGGLPGDRLRVALEPAGRSLFRAEVLDVLEAGPARRAADTVCPRALDRTCGGCDWPAVRPESARALKTELVLDALRRIGRLGPEELPEPRFIASPAGYRLRNRLHFREGRLGFFAPRSHDVSDLTACELVSPALLARLPDLRRAFSDEERLTAEVVTLEGRGGAPLVVEVLAGERYADAQGLALRLRDVAAGVRLVRADGSVAVEDGETSVVIDAGGAAFRVSVSSFFQGNRHLLDAFLDEMRAAVAQAGAGPSARVLDLYAGVGFLTRPLLEAGAGVTAVEADPSAATDLAWNLAAWADAGLPRGTAIARTAEDFLAGFRKRVDLVVADPPRAGLSPAVLGALRGLAPRSLLLVSCDPATLARDLGLLAPDYRVDRFTLLDLFPSTHHVEALLLLTRRRP